MVCGGFRGWLKPEWGAEEQEEELLLLQLPGCEDVRMSGLAWAPPVHQAKRERETERESRAAEGGALWSHMETYWNVPYESCGIVDRQHHRIYTFGKRVAYLTFLPGVHSTLCVCTE